MNKDPLLYTSLSFSKQLTVKSFLILVAVIFGFSSCTKKQDENLLVINSYVRANIKSLDPVSASDVYSNEINSQIYEPLLHYHYLKRPLVLEPLAAASMPEVTPDGLTHTIKIRPDLRFHDSTVFPNGKGRLATSKDFVYAWKRLADPKNRSDGFWIFDGYIKGLSEWRKKMSEGTADYSTPIEGFQTPDDHTIVINLVKQYYQLHYVLTMTYSAPVPHEAIAKYGKEYANHPIGTGPFKFSSWVRNSRVELVKNPTWHGGTYPSVGEADDEKNGLLVDAGKSLPFVDKVIFHVVIEDQPRWLKLLKGEVDFVSIPKDNFESTVQNDKMTAEFDKKGLKLFITPEPDVTYTAFNMSDPFLSRNRKVRQAMALAYDSKTSIEKFYNNRAIPAHSPIPPGVDGYDPNFKNPNQAFNIERAKGLLSKAGFPEGKGLPEFEFSSLANSTGRQMAEFFKQNMSRIGVKIKIVTSSWPQLTSKIRDRKAQIYGIAWMADYPDAQNFLQLLFGPNSSPGPNGANFADNSFDQLYRQASGLPPGKKRTAIYHQMRDISVEKSPWIFGAHRLGYFIKHSWLGNFKRHSIVSDFYKYLKIDPKLKTSTKAKL